MRAVDVANYLVERWGRCYPATIHKLNRLVYLVQAEAIATMGEPLFEDRIEAWQCGPVVPAVIHAFGEWGDMAITEPTEHVEVKPDTARLIDSVAEKQGSWL
ncbi:Panacea domain-containing protein [Parolsenella catena]|uniref:Panacea domain-containing protein n=1 Tax=Parolsenella catena TaxID=2003188 RepID=UPI00319EB64C